MLDSLKLQNILNYELVKIMEAAKRPTSEPIILNIEAAKSNDSKPEE